MSKDRGWTADGQETLDTHEVIVYGGDGDEVARVRGNLALDVTAAERARLIAAAPELLEALQIMLSIWEYPGLPRKHSFILNGGDPKALCQAAITKALGDTL